MIKKLVATLWIFSMAIPLLLIILSAVGTTWDYPRLLPDFTGNSGQNIQAILQNAFKPVISSLLYSLGTVFITLALTLLPARYLSRHDFGGKSLLEIILLLPAVISPFTFLMGIQFILLKSGLGNSYVGIIIILTIVSYPYMLRALKAGYDRLSPDIYHCAKGLGASPLTALVRVEIPLMIPSVLAGGNIVFLVAFSDYFLVFVMGGARIKSLALLIFPLLTSSSRNIVSLYNLLFLAVPLILFLLLDGLIMSYYRQRNM